MPKNKLFIMLSSLALALAPVIPALAADADDSIRAIQKEAIAKQLDGDIDGAIDIYEKAAAIASQEYGKNSQLVGDIYFDIGVLALDSAKFDRAEEYLSRAAQVKTNSVNAHLKLAQLLTLRGTSEKTDQALREIQTAISKDPSSPEARQALAMFYQQQHQPTRALHQYYYLDQAIKGKIVPAEKFNLPPSKSSYTPPPAVETKPVYTQFKPQVNFVKPQPTPQPAQPPRKRRTPPPTPKPRVIEAPVAKPKPKPVLRELKAEPEKLSPRPRPVKSKNGLIPPPPPVMPMFGGAAPPPPMPGVNPGYNLRTDAKIKKPKSAEPAEEKPTKTQSSPPPSSGDNTDFLLDWAKEPKKK